MKQIKNELLLYAVTDSSWLAGRTLPQCVKEAILGGVTMVQLREKALDYSSFLSLAREVQAVCRRYQVPFLINDNLDVAIEIDADGIHVGQDDLSVEAIKARWSREKIIGVSAQTTAQALAAESAGADYLGVGAVFPTGTKKDAVEVSAAELKAIISAVKIPVCAIGGIHQDNIAQLYGSGIAGVALVSEIFQQKDIQENARILRDLVSPLQEGGERE